MSEPISSQLKVLLPVPATPANAVVRVSVTAPDSPARLDANKFAAERFRGRETNGRLCRLSLLASPYATRPASSGRRRVGRVAA